MTAEVALSDLDGYGQLNRYTQIIVDEAVRRGIAVEIVDPEVGELRLSLNGRTVTTLESLSELTSAIAFRRCDDKLQTRRVLQRASLPVPAGKAATFDDADLKFLETWEDLVVKPARGEQGRGITVGVTTAEELERACRSAQEYWNEVLLEQRCHGEDLRAVIIGDELVAASVRRPATICGTGHHTVGELIEHTSRLRSDATAGASKIPLDDITLETVRRLGYELETIVPAEVSLTVRGTANLHTGGTINDVTDDLHPDIAALALAATKAVGLPVAGVDLIIRDVGDPDAVIIEVNEQPGLANHEPRPTAARFVDLLFPETRA